MEATEVQKGASRMELAIRVFEGRGFAKLPANHAVRVQGVVLDRVQETSSSKFSHGQTFGAAQPTWENDRSGVLLWKMTRQELSERLGYLKLCYSTTRRDRAQWEIPSHSDTCSTQRAIATWLRTRRRRVAQLRGVKHTMELKLRCTINKSQNPLDGQHLAPKSISRRRGWPQQRVRHGCRLRRCRVHTHRKQGDEPFTLDVTLEVGGLGLIARVASTSASSDTELPTGPYYLTYNMFGVTTDTDSFDSLEQPVFHPIIDSFRLQSCAADLAHFFAHEVLPLEVRLCGAGDTVLATAQIDCAPLAGAVGAKEFHGAELEGSYPLHPASALTAPAEAELKGSSRPILFAAVAIRPVRGDNEHEDGDEADPKQPLIKPRALVKKILWCHHSAADAAAASPTR